MFLYLIIGVIVLSSVLAFAGVSVTDEIAVPDTVQVIPDYYEDTTPADHRARAERARSGYEDGWHLEEVTIPIKSLLSIEGIRFIFTSFVPNFAGFGVVAVTFVALMGAGVAEAGGLMAALIRLLVGASPRRLLAFILIFVGVLSSVASDAGYLILVPLGAAAFLSVGRHPLAGMAACFAGVGAVFGVNPILGPIDAMITEITNEALGVGRGRAADDRRQLVLQHRVVDRAGHRRGGRHRADRRAAPRGISSRRRAVVRPVDRDARRRWTRRPRSAACATRCSASSASSR